MATHLAQIAALVGIILPLIVAIVQQKKWTPIVRTVVGVSCIIVASVITAWAQGKLNWHDWATTVTTIFLMAQVSYHTVWKKTGIPIKIETATSPGS